MATYDELVEAFKKADDLAQQGDEQARQDAQYFADQIRRMKTGGGERKKEEKPELSGLDTASAVAQNIASGATFGLGDELAGFGSALGGAIYDITQGEMPSWNYSAGVERARARERQFNEENPLTAAGLEVVGSFANPLSRAMSGIGQGATVLSRAAQQAGRGAVEGGLYGLGEGEGSLENRLQTGLTGAATGAAIGGALSGLTGAFSRRNVAANVGRGDSQVPLNMADAEGRLGKFYRAFVGNAMGGRGTIGRMERQAIVNNPELQQMAAGNPRLQNVLKAAGDESISSKELLQELQDAIAGTRDDVVQRLGREGRGLTGRGQRAKERIARGEKASKAAINQERRAIAQAKQEGVDAARTAMRRDQALASLPPDAPDDLRELAKNMQTTDEIDDFVGRLDDWWTNTAYGAVKEAKLPVDNTLINSLEKTLKPDDFNLYKEMLEDAIESGRPISGKFLLDLRNDFARGANRVSDRYTSGELTQVKQRLDGQINRLLRKTDNKPAIAQFREHNQFYADKSDFEKAVGRAQGAGGAGFTEKQLAATGRGRKDFVRGQRSSLQRARQAENQIRRVESAADDAQTVLQGQTDEVAKRAKSRRQGLNRSLDERKERVRRGVEDARSRANSQLQTLKDVSAGRVVDSPSAWSTLASTAALGLPFAASGPGAIAAGSTVAYVLSRPSTQRLLAGQTRAQNAIRTAMEQGNANEVLAILARIGALEAID